MDDLWSHSGHKRDRVNNERYSSRRCFNPERCYRLLPLYAHSRILSHIYTPMYTHTPIVYSHMPIHVTYSCVHAYICAHCFHTHIYRHAHTPMCSLTCTLTQHTYTERCYTRSTATLWSHCTFAQSQARWEALSGGGSCAADSACTRAVALGQLLGCWPPRAPASWGFPVGVLCSQHAKTVPSLPLMPSSWPPGWLPSRCGEHRTRIWAHGGSSDFFSPSDQQDSLHWVHRGESPS